MVALASDDVSDLQRMVDRVAEENDGLMLDYTFLSDPGRIRHQPLRASSTRTIRAGGRFLTRRRT